LPPSTAVLPPIEPVSSRLLLKLQRCIRASGAAANAAVAANASAAMSERFAFLNCIVL